MQRGVHGELGVVGGRCARIVLDGKLAAAWAGRGDVSMSVGTTGVRGVTRASRACWGAVVEKGAVSVHGKASKGGGVLELGQRGCIIRVASTSGEGGGA